MEHHSSSGVVLPRAAVFTTPMQGAGENEWRDWSVQRAQLFPPTSFLLLSWHKLGSRSFYLPLIPSAETKVFWVEPPQLNQCHNYSCHSQITWFLQIKDLLGAETLKHLCITCSSHSRNKEKSSFRSFGSCSGGCCCWLMDKRTLQGPKKKKGVWVLFSCLFFFFFCMTYTSSYFKSKYWWYLDLKYSISFLIKGFEIEEENPKSKGWIFFTEFPASRMFLAAALEGCWNSLRFLQARSCEGQPTPRPGGGTLPVPYTAEKVRMNSLIRNSLSGAASGKVWMHWPWQRAPSPHGRRIFHLQINICLKKPQGVSEGAQRILQGCAECADKSW